MNNFRNYSSGRKTVRGVDGIVGRPTQSAGSHYNRGPQLKQSSVNNFKATDGFRPNAQMQMKPRNTQVAPTQGVSHHSAKSTAAPRPAPVATSGAKRGRHSKQRNWRRLSFKLAGTAVLIVVLMSGFLFTKGYLKARGIFQGGGNAPALAENVDPTTLNGEGDGRVNILMLGRGGDGHDGADLTDTIIVASIDPIQKQASLLSIPRDFWVKTDNGASKINAVYATAKNAVLSNKVKTNELTQKAEDAGVKALQAKIQEAMGVPVHYYVMLDFQAFVEAIDTVGGVDITIDPNDTSAMVTERLWDKMTGKHYLLDVKAGENHFDGQRALMYSRSRHTSARGDFDRAERQRKVIVALKDKVLSAGTYGNPVKINQLIDNFGNHVRSNLTTGELLRIYELAKEIDSTKINSLGLADPPNVLVTTDNVNGQSIVRPIAGLFDYSAIQGFVRNALRDSYLQQESANVAVYNGTKITGLASKKADELKSYGYGVTTVANAPDQALTTTVIVDLTNGQKKFTKHYLEQRFGVTAVTSMPTATIDPGGADFVIILGTDANVNQ